MFEGYSDTDLIKEVLDNNPKAYSENTRVALPFGTPNTDPLKLFNSSYIKIFMMIDIVLALMMLDKYLHRRKNGMRGKTV